jgi:acylphosphatase
MTAEPRLIRHVSVRGRVQGVGFRAFVEHHARQRDLQGWVRNRRDGSVEAVFAGPRDSVEAMVRTMGVGPLAGQVAALDQREGAEDELTLRLSGDAFSVLPTA